MLEIGLTHTTTMVVRSEDSAIAMGSGNLPVFATPALVALMENAAMNAVAPFLPEGSTTVGGKIDVMHIKPSLIGAEVEAVARLTETDGRKLLFEITAYEGTVVIGKATHLRVVVDGERFMEKIK